MAQARQTGRRVLVCRVSDLPDGAAVRVPREETGSADAIAVFHDGGEFFALNDTCPHASASLSEGWIEDGQVECPLHNAVFDLRDGSVLLGPAAVDAVAHEVRVDDGELWLLPRPDGGG